MWSQKTSTTKAVWFFLVQQRVST